MARRKVLVVDDDTVFVDALSAVLESRFEVVTAANGGEALARIAAGKPDVVLELVRGPEARWLAPGGIGLGLTIVKAATELHGGTVTLKARASAGTTVMVKLPLRNAPPPGSRRVMASAA